MPDEMFFSADEKCLRRGQRSSPRTDTCRPCWVWLKDSPERRLRGVVMDLSPHGMRVRMIEVLPTETPVVIQLMRDDEYRIALSVPQEGRVVRYESGSAGLTDHGIELTREAIRRPEPQPARIRLKPTLPPPNHPRMHTIDFTVGGRGGGR